MCKISDSHTFISNFYNVFKFSKGHSSKVIMDSSLNFLYVEASLTPLVFFSPDTLLCIRGSEGHRGSN